MKDDAYFVQPAITVKALKADSPGNAERQTRHGTAKLRHSTTKSKRSAAVYEFEYTVITHQMRKLYQTHDAEMNAQDKWKDKCGATCCEPIKGTSDDDFCLQPVLKAVD